MTLQVRKRSHSLHCCGGTSSATPTTPVETVPPKPADPPADGMVSWFKSEHAGTFWPSSVGNFVGVGWPRSVVRATEAGFGADRPVTMVKGRDFQGMAPLAD